MDREAASGACGVLLPDDGVHLRSGGCGAGCHDPRLAESGPAPAGCLAQGLDLPDCDQHMHRPVEKREAPGSPDGSFGARRSSCGAEDSAAPSLMDLARSRFHRQSGGYRGK
ncbi:hypothetical protein D3C81_1883510 [compost metagenome]